MRLTADHISAAFTSAAIEAAAAPGQAISFERVAELLNQQLTTHNAGRLSYATPTPAGFAAPVALVAPERGRCRICSCTDNRACLVATGSAGEFDDRRACGWADPTHTLCDNPRCLDRADQADAA
jgi:hypothetical protein